MTEDQFLANLPAFPHEHRTGMTLRDYFAAMAMQAILQSSGKWGKETADALHYEDNFDVVATKAMCLAEGAYEMADAMLKTRDA